MSINTNTQIELKDYRTIITLFDGAVTIIIYRRLNKRSIKICNKLGAVIDNKVKEEIKKINEVT